MRLSAKQRPYLQNAQVGPLFDRSGGAIVIDAAAVHTYTVDEFSGPLILRDPNGGTRSDVTPTAVALIAADPSARVGDCFKVAIRNTGAATEVITMVGGAGVTISGTATVAVSSTKEFLCVITGASTVSLYSLGTTTT